MSLGTLPENSLFQIANELTYGELKNHCKKDVVFNTRICQNQQYWRQRSLEKNGNVEDTVAPHLLNWEIISRETEKFYTYLEEAGQLQSMDQQMNYANNHLLTNDRNLSNKIYRTYYEQVENGIPPNQTLPFQLMRTRNSQLIAEINQNWVNLPEPDNGFDVDAINALANGNLNNLTHRELVGLVLIIRSGGSLA